MNENILNAPMEDVVQNMRDAGCSPETIHSCISSIKRGRKEELLKKLYTQRNCLLDKVHEGERQIDCLDYLVYTIAREQ